MRLKITTIVSDDETGNVLTKQESIIDTEPKNYFGLKNTGHDLSYFDHMKKYGTINEPIDTNDRAISSKIDDVSGIPNDIVLEACKEYLEK